MLTFYDPDGEADAFKDSEILRKHFKVKEKIQAKMIIIANALEGQRDQWSVADYEKSTFFKIGSSNLLRKTIKENAVILAGICKLKTKFFSRCKNFPINREISSKFAEEFFQTSYNDFGSFMKKTIPDTVRPLVVRNSKVNGHAKFFMFYLFLTH